MFPSFSVNINLIWKTFRYFLIFTLKSFVSITNRTNPKRLFHLTGCNDFEKYRLLYLILTPMQTELWLPLNCQILVPLCSRPVAPECTRCRDVSKWPLVLVRTFLGESDKCPVSKFCTLLISYGIKESASPMEFFLYVLYNLSSELNMELVNYLLSKKVIEDQHDSIRLSLVYEYLKVAFRYHRQSHFVVREFANNVVWKIKNRVIGLSPNSRQNSVLVWKSWKSFRVLQFRSHISSPFLSDLSTKYFVVSLTKTFTFLHLMKWLKR